MHNNDQEAQQNNIRVTLAYDGTGFAGWQIQKDKRTVQGEVETALEKMHRRRVKIYAAGRTDSGVHARGQVINFRSDISSLSPDRFFVALNSYLPPDVQAINSTEVPPDFHSRYSARLRTYRYYLLPAEAMPPEHRLYCLRIRYNPDIAALNRLCVPLLGVHDFTSFALPRDVSTSKKRRIQKAVFFMDGPFLVFEISANAFLWRMVRSILGTLLNFEREGKGPEALEKVIHAQSWDASGESVPSAGLFLHSVRYEGEVY